MMEARANARLALMIAIGELQKQMGPDQRISARAEILDTNPTTLEADGVAHPHYLGVWESWNTWLTDNKGSLSIQDTYQYGRNSSLFRKWLVSSRAGQDSNFALSDPGTERMVVICGEGSLGTDIANHVRVPLVGISDGDQEIGRYAWWVTDESQKARIDMMPREEPSSVSEALVTSSHTGRMGVEKLTDMDTFDTSPESLAKTISLGQAGISANGVPQNFHALTAHSVGLFTDVRSGGFKSDINLALEADTLPTQMNETQLFGGRPFDPPIRPFTGELANITPQNPYIAPMGWRTLREYYRLYRSFPSGDTRKPVQWQGDQPVANRFLMASDTSQNMWDVAGYARQPVLLRQTWVLATMTENDPLSADGRAYYVIAVPVVSLWNPYNVPLEINSTEISTFGTMYFTAPLFHTVYRDGNVIDQGRFPSGSVTIGKRPNGQDLKVSNPVTSNQDGYRMIPVEPGLGVIRFEPGEVRVFSTDSDLSQSTNLYAGTGAQSNRHFLASPGYTPIQSGAGALRGLKNRVASGTTASGSLSMSLRFSVADSNHIDTYWSGGSKTSVVGFLFQEKFGNQQGLYLPDGSPLSNFNYNEWHDVYRLGLFSIDWLRTAEVNNAWLVDDSPAGRAQWPAPGSTPLPIGILSIVAKTPEQLEYMASDGFSKDYRNRGWLHSPITSVGGSFLINPNDLTRANSAYQVHFTAANSDVDVSQYLEADGRNGFFGGGYSQSEGVKHVSALNIPVAPTTSLAAFTGAAVSPSRSFTDQISDNHASPSIPRPTSGPVGHPAYRNRKYYNLKHATITGAAFGAGIGNAYAHPMIDAEDIYTRHDIGTDPGWDGAGTHSNNFAMCDDYWDHLFLSNEELWDSWFCSNIAPAMNRGSVMKSLKDVAIDFFNSESTRLPTHYLPYEAGKTAKELGDLVEVDDAAYGDNGWDKIGAHILNKGQFNVNSTSKAAWKAMFMSLAERPFAVGANGDGISVVEGGEEVTLTRHPLANGEESGSGLGDENSWRGMRTLTDPQIDKLAEEMVRQVKLRGPFLNMADFINRRLSDDELGVTGALQAAIDWDEFNAGYDGTTAGSGESINGGFKDSTSMIRKSQLAANYPNEMAAAGSLYAGIPGYVMQSDILQGLGNSLSVRGDTFMIRAYGESLSPAGEVIAKAWCEAVIQRTPEYVDETDPADKKIRKEDGLPNGTSVLVSANETYGRKMHIVSFRWLNQNEI